MEAEKRPTRAEALKVADGALNASVRPRTEDVVDAVAALFGGFAPEPVRVPRTEAAQVAGAAHVISADTHRLLSEAVVGAITERSNVWEALRKEVAGAADWLGDAMVSQSRSCGDHLNRALALMSAPSMGTGPEVEG